MCNALGIEPRLGECCPIPVAIRVEYGDVGDVTFAYVTAIGETKEICGES